MQQSPPLDDTCSICLENRPPGDPRRIELNGKAYNISSLAKWIQEKRTVPHSRRTLSAREVENIVRREREFKKKIKKNPEPSKFQVDIDGQWRNARQLLASRRANLTPAQMAEALEKTGHVRGPDGRLIKRKEASKLRRVAAGGEWITTRDSDGSIHAMSRDEIVAQLPSSDSRLSYFEKHLKPHLMHYKGLDAMRKIIDELDEIEDYKAVAQERFSEAMKKYLFSSVAIRELFGSRALNLGDLTSDMVRRMGDGATIHVLRIPSEVRVVPRRYHTIVKNLVQGVPPLVTLTFHHCHHAKSQWYAKMVDEIIEESAGYFDEDAIYSALDRLSRSVREDPCRFIFAIPSWADPSVTDDWASVIFADLHHPQGSLRYLALGEYRKIIKSEGWYTWVS